MDLRKQGWCFGYWCIISKKWIFTEKLQFLSHQRIFRKAKLKEIFFTLCPAAINCCATGWPAFCQWRSMICCVSDLTVKALCKRSRNSAVLLLIVSSMSRWAECKTMFELYVKLSPIYISEGGYHTYLICKCVQATCQRTRGNQYLHETYSWRHLTWIHNGRDHPWCHYSSLGCWNIRRPSVRNAPLSPESRYIPYFYCFLSFFRL